MSKPNKHKAEDNFSKIMALLFFVGCTVMLFCAIPKVINEVYCIVTMKGRINASILNIEEHYHSGRNGSFTHTSDYMTYNYTCQYTVNDITYENTFMNVQDYYRLGADLPLQYSLKNPARARVTESDDWETFVFLPLGIAIFGFFEFIFIRVGIDAIMQNRKKRK